MQIPPQAVEAWRRVREIQARYGNAEPDATTAIALRQLVLQIGHVLDFDARLVEPARVNGHVWAWMNEPEHFERFELARKIADALDAALAVRQQQQHGEPSNEYGRSQYCARNAG